MRRVTAKEMQEIDRIAIEEQGIPSLTLMENAGKAVAEVAMDMAKPDASISIVCGRGNNGGDGLVAARYLIENGYKPSICLLGDISNIKNDVKVNLEKLTKLNYSLANEINPDSDLIIDAIFGTGFKGETEGKVAQIIEFINALKRPVLTVDVPSGLDATTGKAAKFCIKADKTVTFGLPKQGFYVGDGPKYAGQITVKQIGFPKELLE